MDKITRTQLAAAAILLASGPANAFDPNMIPEPSVIGLLVAGGIVGAIIAIRKRRK